MTKKSFRIMLVALFFGVFSGFLFGADIEAHAEEKALGSASASLLEAISEAKIDFSIPDDFERWPEKGAGTGINPNGTNTLSTETATGHMVNGVKVIYYKPMVWGDVEADFEDFKKKAKETLNSEQGWKRAGLKFIEVQSGQDVNLILSDAAHLEATGGCSGDLSCTTFNNEVIINDLRWREGTEASRAAGMGTRDYQHMVINHEMGHWLGHYSHVEKCDAGGPAPIMLQQSTGMRGCESFNPWPLDFELWTLR